MRMKMFSAETMDQAQAMILAEFGEAAVILSEREIDGGVEVRAAIDRSQTASLPEPRFEARPDAERDFAVESLRMRLRELLVWHGAPNAFAELVANSAAKLTTPETEPRQALATALEGVVACAPIPALPDRNLLLVGPPGAGRTATAAKLTRRAAMANHELTPLAADFDATAGGEQLAAYLERERRLVRTAADPGALFRELDKIQAAKGRCVIDLPAINPFDVEDLARLKDLLSAIDAEPLLVLAAAGHPADLEESARAFADIGVRRAVITKLDTVRRRGGIFAALASAKLSLSHMAVTPFIGGGLVPAAPGRISTLLIEDAPGQDALKGAA